MRPFIDDLDEFAVFDTARARRLFEKQRRKEMRFANGLSSGPRQKHPDEDYDDYQDYEEYDDYEDYDDYNEDEFDSYARVHRPY